MGKIPSGKEIAITYLVNTMHIVLKEGQVSSNQWQTASGLAIRLSREKPQLNAVMIIENGEVKRALVNSQDPNGEEVSLLHQVLHWHDRRQIQACQALDCLASFVQVERQSLMREDNLVSFAYVLKAAIEKAGEDLEDTVWTPDEAVEQITALVGRSNPTSPGQIKLTEIVKHRSQLDIELKAR